MNLELQMKMMRKEETQMRGTGRTERILASLPINSPWILFIRGNPGYYINAIRTMYKGVYQESIDHFRTAFFHRHCMNYVMTADSLADAKYKARGMSHSVFFDHHLMDKIILDMLTVENTGDGLSSIPSGTIFQMKFAVPDTSTILAQEIQKEINREIVKEVTKIEKPDDPMAVIREMIEGEKKT